MTRIYATSKPAILHAAVKAATERGLMVFTRADVTKAIGLAEATISYHFGSTNKLREAVALHAVKHELVALLADSRAITRLGIMLPSELREKIANYIARRS